MSLLIPAFFLLIHPPDTVAGMKRIALIRYSFVFYFAKSVLYCRHRFFLKDK